MRDVGWSGYGIPSPCASAAPAMPDMPAGQLVAESIKPLVNGQRFNSRGGLLGGSQLVALAGTDGVNRHGSQLALSFIPTLCVGSGAVHLMAVGVMGEMCLALPVAVVARQMGDRLVEHDDV